MIRDWSTASRGDYEAEVHKIEWNHLLRKQECMQVLEKQK